MGRTFLIAPLITIGLGLLIPAHARSAPPEAAGKERHWAFQAVRRPNLPEVADPAWSVNPIDRFVLSRMEAEGIKAVEAADRRTLLRRLYLDLIGLPPTPDEVRAFLEDGSPRAVARAVDDLLARPQYGERWARHWLDVVRYAESNGYERDGTKPHAWRYRDYVIDALNRDLPFDRFLTEQLAGDEVEGSDARSQVATTFLRLGTWDDEPAEPMVDRYDQLDDVLGTTATVFLGITLRCARCHDHKFEPFSQADYYRMLAVFQPLKRPQNDRADLDREVGTEAELADYHAKLARSDTEIARAREQMNVLVRQVIDRRLGPSGEGLKGLPADAILAFRTLPGKRTRPQIDLVRKFGEKIIVEARGKATPEWKAAIKAQEDRIAALAASRPKAPPRAYIWYEEGPKAPATRLLKRGNPEQPGDAVEPGIPAVLASRQPDPPRPRAKSTGRRLWLARWLASPANPLVSRVIVNRIWQFHFGEGLVATSNDLGLMGDPPSHPELLDWLAQEFVASGWRLKPLHRMIVLSQAYQRASASAPEGAPSDGGGKLLRGWRQRRLEAEVVRDSILAVSGQLNPRMGGPGFYPNLPRAVLEGQSRPGDGWGRSNPREQARRSIYIFAKRSLGVPELELLDAPDTTSSCERRSVSTTGPQALTFLNGEFIHEQARHFASRLVAEAGSAGDRQVARAFLLALGRPPRVEESRTAIEFLRIQEAQIRADTAASTASGLAPDVRRRALEAFCLVLLNTNEFVFIN